MTLPVFIALLLSMAGAFCDLKWRRIPNELAVAGWIAGLLLWLYLQGFGGTIIWIGGFMGVGAAAVAVYLLGGIGGGDVKLLMALGGILSFKRGLWVFFVSAVIALIYSLMKSARRGALPSFVDSVRSICRGWYYSRRFYKPENTEKICFCGALLAGMVCRILYEGRWLW